MSVEPCPHCGAFELVQHAWQKSCLTCGKWSGEKPAPVETPHDNLPRRTDVTGPSAESPAATPTSLITGARPAAMTTTPELEGKKLATKSARDATQVPVAPEPPADPPVEGA
jgi:hypothetical protein